MALSDRKPPTAYATKLDRLLAELPDADSAWLLEHLTTKGPGGWATSSRWLSGELKDEAEKSEYPDLEVSRSTIDEWRKNRVDS